MSKENKDNKKKKGPLSAIWESMNKTGGCCGPGEICGCGAEEVNKKNGKDNKKLGKK